MDHIDQSSLIARAVRDEEADPMICYCFRLTRGQLEAARDQHGSLKKVEELTRVGTACTGCKVMLESIFGERPSNHYEQHEHPLIGSTCRKPGSRLMKGFVIANGDLESTVISSNGTAPQLGACDADSQIEWMLLDHRAQPVLNGSQLLKTNETFVFDTRGHSLPRPFFGMFILAFDRSNCGASRFNIYWGNRQSVSGTHETSDTGRPMVILPVPVSRELLSGPSTLYAALMNPHSELVKFAIVLRELETDEKIVWHTELPPYCSIWLDTNAHLFTQAFKHSPNGQFTLGIETESRKAGAAISMYFFFHNRISNLWTANHL